MIHHEVRHRVCVLRLDRPPLNAIDLGCLRELREALVRAAADDQVDAVIVTGSGEHFSAGADVQLFREIASPDDAVRISQEFQEAFEAFEACPKPVVAALHGRVMGGGLELAAACHRRVAAQGTRLNMPEVRLGINPGGGGTARLPRLVGVEAALRMMLTGESVDATAARSLGLVDEVCEPEALLDVATRLALAPDDPLPTGRRTKRIADGAANEAGFQAAEAWLPRHRPELIAPGRIVRCVRVGIEESFQAGIEQEQRAFAACMETRATRNLIYVFFATRAAGKLAQKPPQEPREIHHAAVVGMGSMGTGIATALAFAGIPAVVLDEREEALAKACRRIKASLEKRIARGKLPPGHLDRLPELVRPTSRWEEIAAVDLVVESVFENLAVKQAVLRRVEEVCPAETIVATNTSTLSLDALARAMQHPQRLIGLHFFNPAHHMPLVEVIRRETTPEALIARGVAFAKRLGKTPVVVNNREGFLVNRVFVPYLVEAFRLLEEGAPAEAIDAAMVEFGFPMGPLVLGDMTGLEIVAHAQRELARAFAWHGALPEILARLVDAGHLGQKTGAGVYRYQAGDRTPKTHAVTERWRKEISAAAGREAEGLTAGRIVERLVLRMVAEAFRLLGEGVARSETDLDAAMVLGTGFPAFRGGIVRYARDAGLDSMVRRLENLANSQGERYAVCGHLRAIAGAES